MCEDKVYISNIYFTSVTKHNKRKSCNINNGKNHEHIIEVENIRRESLLVCGTASSYHKKVFFVKNGSTNTSWDIDIKAVGKQKAWDSAGITVQTNTASGIDVIETELLFEFDDPFPNTTMYYDNDMPVKIDIQVRL